LLITENPVACVAPAFIGCVGRIYPSKQSSPVMAAICVFSQFLFRPVVSRSQKM